MCYLQKVSTLLKNGNVCQPSSLQTKDLREKKRMENRQKKQGFQFGVCDNSLDKIDQAKPFWGKTFHQSWSEKNIADSAADDSVQRSVSSYARGVTCRNVPFAIYSLSLFPLEHRFKRRPYKYTRIEAGATTTKQFRSPGIEHFYPIPPPPDPPGHQQRLLWN